MKQDQSLAAYILFALKSHERKPDEFLHEILLERKKIKSLEIKEVMKNRLC